MPVEQSDQVGVSRRSWGRRGRTPKHDHPRVEVLLAELVAGEEAGADSKHEKEDHGVGDEGGSHDEVRETAG